MTNNEAIEIVRDMILALYAEADEKEDALLKIYTPPHNELRKCAAYMQFLKEIDEFLLRLLEK